MLKKIKGFIEEYKAELLLETVVIGVLIVLGYCGKIRLDNILDGTFLAAVLSIPLVIIQYIGTKKKEKNYIKENIYYEKLDKLIEISNSDPLCDKNNKNFFEEERDENIIKIRLLQLNNIYESGIKNINSEDVENFLNTLRNISYRLIFKGIRVDSKQSYFKNTFKVRLANHSEQLTQYLVSVEHLIDIEKSNKYNDQKNIGDSLGEFNKMLKWGGEYKKVVTGNETNKDEEGIFFKSTLIDFYQEDIDKYSNTIFVNPIFKYEEETEIGAILDNLCLENYMLQDDGALSEDSENSSVLIIKPYIKLKTMDEPSDYNILKHKYLLSKNNNKIQATYKFDNETDRSRLRSKYGKNVLIKFSRTYPNPESEYAFESWFRIHRNAWEKEKARNDDRDIVFIVVNQEGDLGVGRSLIIKFKKKTINELIERKNGNLDLENFDFYFKIKKSDYRKYVDTDLALTNLYDTRKQDDIIEISLTQFT